MVLPGLTRASSSFTITSNHQNILPLWPAAPPPGQPVVFFCPLSGVRPACFPSARRHGLPRGREGRSRPVPWSMRSALPDTRQGRGIFPFQVPVFEGAAALGHQGRTAFVCGALRCARCPAGFGRPGVAALLRPYAHRSWPGCSCSPAITDGTAHVCSRKFAVPLFLTLLSYHGDAVRCPPAVRQGSGKAHTGASPAAIRRHKKRRPPAWRPADVWSRFTDAARGIRTVCRAGKRWPRNRRPARRHCSTGHGSGSWPGSCARRTWA